MRLCLWYGIYHETKSKPNNEIIYSIDNKYG